MARLPGPEALGTVQARSPGVRRAARSAIPDAIKGLGDTISLESERDSALSLQLARKKKAEDDTLDSARATSDWNTRLLNEQSNYDLEKNPKYDTWEKNISTNLPKHQEESAKLIRDPKRRELFLLQSKDDITKATFGVKSKAEGFDADKRLAEGFAAIDQNLALAAAPGTSPEQSERIIAQTRTMFDNMAISGLLPPGKVIEGRQNFAKKYASLKVTQDIESNPAEAVRHLRGGSNEVYFNKLRKQESGGSDTIKASTSSATGRYQFTEGTWGELRKAHPELALTADGRTNASQQERAIRAFTSDNARALEGAGLAASEANLYLAHFMGAGGAIKALNSNPNATAASLFPEAASANRSIFYEKDGAPRTVAEVIALQTKNFSGQSGPAPDYYKLLEPDDRLRLASASEGEWARREKEADDASALEKYAMSQSVDNDLTQLAATGTATGLGQEQVRATLGDAKAAEWLTERETAVKTFQATTALDNMGTGDMSEYLDDLEPSAGDPNFAQAQKVYEAAQTKATKLQTLRMSDPALSVQDSPVVKKAMEAYDPEQPATIQALVKARLASQDAVKIPGAMQQPITKAEARGIIGPIQTTMDMIDATTIAAVGGTKGDAKARRQAIKEAQKVAEEEVRNIINSVEKNYGPYAQRVLAYAISEATRDKEVGGITATVYRKIAKGEKPTISEFQALDVVNEASIAEKAMNGTLPAPENNYGTKPSAAVTKAIGDTMGQMGAKRTVYPAPSQRAVDYLKANPQSVADFEKNFGAGSAAQWLPRN